MALFEFFGGTARRQVPVLCEKSGTKLSGQVLAYCYNQENDSYKKKSVLCFSAQPQ
jgi:hypothetical protein